jgi:hypothetical protein
MLVSSDVIGRPRVIVKYMPVGYFEEPWQELCRVSCEIEATAGLSCPTPPRRELLEGSITVQLAAIHSTRRPYATSLRTGVNEQRAMKLTGHSDSKAHQRFQMVALRP